MVEKTVLLWYISYGFHMYRALTWCGSELTTSPLKKKANNEQSADHAWMRKNFQVQIALLCNLTTFI